MKVVHPSPTSTQSLDRRIRMLRTALGPLIAAALADPDVVEVMLNPDGADRMRDLMKTRLIESPVVRSSLHLARQPRSVLR